MNDKKDSPLSKLFGIVFLIWFFGSMAGMIIMAEKNTLVAVMLFGQYFLVFGSIMFFNKGVNKLASLPFLLVGLCCVLIPYFILKPNLYTETINWESVVITILVSVFVIVGLGLLVFPIIIILKNKKINTIKVPAQIIRHNIKDSDGTTMYSPVYSYDYNGEHYELSNYVYYNKTDKIQIGKLENIKLEDGKPTVEFSLSGVTIIPIIMGIMFLSMSLPLLIYLLNTLEYTI